VFYSEIFGAPILLSRLQAAANVWTACSLENGSTRPHVQRVVLTYSALEPSLTQICFNKVEIYRKTDL